MAVLVTQSFEKPTCVLCFRPYHQGQMSLCLHLYSQLTSVVFHSHLRSNVRCCFRRCCALLCVMLVKLIRSNFNPQAERVLESNCPPVSTLILVRIKIYTVMAFSLSITDFIEWL